jgi:hypothetical protein
MKAASHEYCCGCGKLRIRCAAQLGRAASSGTKKHSPRLENKFRKLPFASSFDPDAANLRVHAAHTRTKTPDRRLHAFEIYPSVSTTLHASEKLHGGLRVGVIGPASVVFIRPWFLTVSAGRMLTASLCLYPWNRAEAARFACPEPGHSGMQGPGPHSSSLTDTAMLRFGDRWLLHRVSRKLLCVVEELMAQT